MGETAVRAVACDACGKKYRYKPELAGKKVKCPCGGRVRFPADEVEETPQVDDALQQLAQAESEAPQYDTQEEEPMEAPALPPMKSRAAAAPSAKPARVTKKPSSASSFIDGDKWKWWYFIAGGVFLFGVAAWKYVTLSQAEATGDSGYNRVTGNDRTLYMIFGKWGVVVGTVAAGLGSLAVGVWQFKQQQKAGES